MKILALLALTAAASGPTITITPNPATVGQTVMAGGCGYHNNGWYELDTYGPNTTVDGPLVSVWTTRVGRSGCISNIPVLNPAKTAGTYSTYVSQCGGKGTGDGCVYGKNKQILDTDFTVNP